MPRSEPPKKEKGHKTSRPPARDPDQPRVIDPNAVFLLDELTALLRLRKSSLAREIREKRLRVSRRCGTYFFTGQSVIDWLQSGEQGRAVEAAPGGG
jgi:hypothetical protein